MKALVKMPCEDGNCKHNHEMLIDSDELGLKVENRSPPTAQITKIPEIETHDHSHDHAQEQPKETKFTHTDLAKLMSPGENFRSCPDGNCGTKIRNAKITTKFKKCTTCGSNTVPKKAEFCPTCGKTHDDDDWDESEVEIKTKNEDEEDDE